MGNAGKIVVLVMTLNEQRNISRFLTNYLTIADLVLVSDGGSTDRTVPIATEYGGDRDERVKVRTFETKIPMAADPGFFNPEGEHINSLIEWGVDEGADWLILDGCDSWPNSHLRRDGRRLLLEAGMPQVWLHRLLMWGKDEYLPKYNDPGPSLWAWMPDHTWVWCETETPTLFDSRLLGADPSLAVKLAHPYFVLHYSWPDETEVARKLARYEAWGHPIRHPVEAYGPAVALPRELL